MACGAAIPREWGELAAANLESEKANARSTLEKIPKSLSRSRTHSTEYKKTSRLAKVNSRKVLKKATMSGHGRLGSRPRLTFSGLSSMARQRAPQIDAKRCLSAPDEQNPKS